MGQIQISGMTYFNDATKNTVEREVIDSDANIFNMKVPFSTADTGNLSLTFLGKQRLITVTGTYAGTETDIKNFTVQMDDEVMKANQPDKYYYPSDGRNQIRVQIARFTCIREFIQPFKISYTVDIITTNNVFS